MDNKPNEGHADSLPSIATEFIRRVVREMGYHRKARQEVEAELTAHFEDELRDCASARERGQRAQRLVEGFGDARLLAVLCRRSKKRCRPLWATTLVRTLQATGVSVVLLGLYMVWFVHGRPVVKVDYLAVLNRVSRPQIAEQDNAWPDYRQAIALLVEPDRELQQMPAFRNPDDAKYRDFAALPPKTQGAIEKWVEANRPPWERFIVASANPYLAVAYQNRRDTVDPWLLHVELPDLSAIEQLCRVGLWLSRINFERGRTAEALEDCLIVARVGCHWQRSGTPVEQLRGLKISRIGHEAILRIVASTNLSVAELTDLQRKVASIYFADYPLVDAEFERLVALDVVQHVFTNEGPGGGHLVPPTSAGLVGTAMRETYPTAVKIPLLRTALSVIHAGRAQTVAMVERVFDRYREQSFLSPYQRRTRAVLTVGEMVESLPRHRYALVRSLVPSLDRMVESRFRGRALHQATLTILALQRYRIEKGGYPPSLDELMQTDYLDALPADPYSEKPLSYKVAGNAFSLYSVGPDFDDDGGRSATDSEGRRRIWAKSGDTVFWPVP